MCTILYSYKKFVCFCLEDIPNIAQNYIIQPQNFFQVFKYSSFLIYDINILDRVPVSKDITQEVETITLTLKLRRSTYADKLIF